MSGERCTRWLSFWICIAQASIAYSQTSTLDDHDPAIVYSGEWSSEVDVLARDGAQHSSRSPGARATLDFSGDFVRVLATTGPDKGRAQVRLCSLERGSCESGELDQQSKIYQHGQVVFARYGLSAGRYRLELQVPDAAGSGITVDGVAYGVALQGVHYIDNLAANCSNSHAGDSAAAPWCDFGRVNGETLAAGAQLLLARGGVWNQQLGKLYGEGTKERWIVIGAYGEGPLPAIRRSRLPTDRALWLDNPSYVRVSHLEVENAGAGIVAYFTTNGHTGLRFDHLLMQHNDVVHRRSAEEWTSAADLPGMYHGAAIFITGNVPVTQNTAAISDIEISDVESSHDSDPLDIAGFNPSPGELNFLSTTLGHHAARNVDIHNVWFHDAKGAPNFDNVEALRLFSSRLSGMCTAHQEIGTTSLFFWSVDDVTVANNVISELPYTNSGDGTGTDLESASTRVRFRNNWYLNNMGAGIEVLAFRGEADFQRDHELTGNVFYQNGQSAGLLRIDDLLIGSGIDQVSYEGAWIVADAAHRQIGTDAAASYSVRFYGSQIELYGTLGPNYGIAAVSVCTNDSCGEQVTFDAFSSTRTQHSLLWRSPQLPRDEYRVVVRPTGRKHPLSAGTALDFDSAAVWNPGFFLGVPQEASVFVLNQTGKPENVTGRAQGNLYFEPGGFVSPAPLGQYAWQLSGNRSVAARSLFDARVSVSAAALGYQLYDGTRLRELAADSDDLRWGDQDAYATPFDFLPPACPGCYVARTWQAPHAGAIAMRGWALKHAAGGDGVSLRVTRNAAQVWPRAAGWQALAGDDEQGIGTELDDLEVRQGDVLRFEVASGDAGDNSADLISWSPTLAYTTSAQNGLVVVQDDQASYSPADWTAQSGVHEAQAQGASFSMPFSGSQVTVHGGSSVERGQAVFSVCNLDERCLDAATVAWSAAAISGDQVLWASPIVPYGQYTLQVRAHTPGIRFDYAAVSSNVSFINDDVEGVGTNQVEYRGSGWSQTGNIHFHAGSSPDVCYLVRFTGAQAIITGGKNSDRGIAAFSVCDGDGEGCGAETFVDAYSATLQIKQVLWTSPVLSPGEHAIKVRATQTRNPASTGSIIDFDRAIID